MIRSERVRPRDLTTSWPDVAANDMAGEVARRFAVNVRAAIGTKSIRAVAASSGVHHATVLRVLEGQTWPDFETIARLEWGLGQKLWPGRVLELP